MEIVKAINPDGGLLLVEQDVVLALEIAERGLCAQGLPGNLNFELVCPQGKCEHAGSVRGRLLARREGTMAQGITGRVVRLGLAGALAISPLLTGGAPAGADQNQPAVMDFNHVFIIMMENTSYSSLIGNPNAPWINQAVAQDGFATNYFGVTHPSQPNYIAATSGSTNGVTDDSDVTINVPNIVDQLEAQGKTWKAYMQ